MASFGYSLDKNITPTERIAALMEKCNWEYEERDARRQQKIEDFWEQIRLLEEDLALDKRIREAREHEEG